MAFNVKKINKETNYYVVKNNPHVHKYVPLKFKKGIFCLFIKKHYKVQFFLNIMLSKLHST